MPAPLVRAAGSLHARCHCALEWCAAAHLRRAGRVVEPAGTPPAPSGGRAGHPRCIVFRALARDDRRGPGHPQGRFGLCPARSCGPRCPAAYDPGRYSAVLALDPAITVRPPLRVRHHRSRHGRAPGRPWDRRGTTAAGKRRAVRRSGLRDVHVGIHRPAQGGHGRAPGHLQHDPVAPEGPDDPCHRCRPQQFELHVRPVARAHVPDAGIRRSDGPGRARRRVRPAPAARARRAGKRDDFRINTCPPAA